KLNVIVFILCEQNEKSHTTRFYNEIVDKLVLHHSKVNDNLYVGSCPRLIEHIEYMKNQLNITAVVNLQVISDIENNCKQIIAHRQPQPLGTLKTVVIQDKAYDVSSVHELKLVYDQHQIIFTWLPTVDMSTIGRLLTFPQAVLVLKNLLVNKHRVYVHCNAG
ncbi:unnamed protein product, partial [Didymodactylos carnosus]